MQYKFIYALFAPMLLVVACSGPESASETTRSAEPVAELAVEAEIPMNLPMTTESEEAKAQMADGLHALDMARNADARENFQAAIDADASFALAHLGLAFSANSVEGFRGALEDASKLAAGGSEAEQALIKSAEKAFANDVDGQIEALRHAVTLAPESPRAKTLLAQALAGAGNQAEALSVMTDVLSAHPGFAAAHANLGGLYLFNEPRDFDKGLEHMQKAAELAPAEPQTHDGVGDALRALNRLEEARDAYGRSADLNAPNGQAYQQRGHVNSFLGNWDEARADYDAAIAAASPEIAANFGTWRAFVSSYEGKPEAAIAELEALSAAIDGMGLDTPMGPKIQAHLQANLIASHIGNTKAAKRNLESASKLMMAQAETLGDDFKRRQLAQIAVREGHLAAREGDHDIATAKAEEAMGHLEADANPRKNEAAHQLLGISLLLQGDHAGAIAELEQANLDFVYVEYHLGLAHDGAGNAEEAERIFESVARNNFNSAAYSLIRADAVARTAAETGH